MTDKATGDNAKGAGKTGARGQARTASETGKPAPGHTPRLAWPGLLALALAVAAATAAGLLWRQVQTLRQATQQIDRMERRIAILEQGRQTREAGQVARKRRLQAMERELATLPDMRKALARLRKRLARDRQAWVLAETRYLIHLAGQRLQLAGDVTTALSALRAADARLRRLGRPDLLPLRRRLAEDIQALTAIRRPDIAGMAVRLDSAMQTIAKLPLRNVRRSVRQRRAQSTQAGKADVLARLWHSLRSLVVIRRHDRPIQPMLDRAQARLIRQILLLRLEQARSALLQRDTAAFRAALTRGREWLKTHFDTASAVVAGLRRLLDELARAELRPRLPLPLRASQWRAPAATSTGPAQSPAGNGNSGADTAAGKGVQP